MEDRFRFRVWSPGYAPDHRMQYWYPFSEEQIAICIEPDPIIMQCTGLKDKNGTLIYEGDIIHNEWLVARGDVGSDWIVKFGYHQTSDDYYASRAYGWYAELVGGGFESERSLAQMPGDMIVIGNIYEPSSISKNPPTPPDLAPEQRSKPDTGQGSD